MDLKDMILVMENYKGTERNMLMTLEDYKKFVAIDDMSELADQMLLLGRTLAEGFTEYYRAANVTVFAKFCRDDVELGRFLQGYYNDSKKFYFDKATSSPECITKMDEIGMTDRGWIDDFILHYEKCDRTFERGQTFHNFNDHDYMVLEALSPRNLVVMDMKSGSLTIALGATEYKRYPKDEEPTKDNTAIGVSWEHGIYLGSTLSQTNFKAYKREYGTPEKIKDVYDYRAKLKQKFYFYQDLSKDDDIPKNMQNDFLHQMYKEFGTIEEEYFYDRLEDGKYDEGFKERQVYRMEKEFDIEIKEVLSRVETVKAESLDDAINKAMDMYYSEQIVLDAEDMKGVDFSPYSEEQLPSSLKENGGKTR